MNLNSSMATTLEDCLLELGGIPASRVRLSPPPGQATLADLLAVNRADSRGLFELVDGTLVEKGIVSIARWPSILRLPMLKHSGNMKRSIALRFYLASARLSHLFLPTWISASNKNLPPMVPLRFSIG